MKQPTRSPAITIELIVVMFVLALSGLAVAFIIDISFSRLPWYVWPLSFFLFPGAVLALSLRLPRRPKR